MVGALLVLAAVIVVPVAIGVSNSNARTKRLLAYRAALGDLGQEPQNAELRQRALALGRAHYGGLHSGGRPTAHDELAITNDIQARLAVAS